VTTIQPLVIFDIDGVVRDVGGSYRRALADTVEHFTNGNYRPSQTEIDALKAEGFWNNDWEASQELIRRYYHDRRQAAPDLAFEDLVAWFQQKYRGPDPQNWTGYICQEPLLMSANYLQQLDQASLSWGFVSGATRASATYVLETRLGLVQPPLIAMEDAPGKPDPTGLLAMVQQLEAKGSTSSDSLQPVIYVGDTVADMQTVVNAQRNQADRLWVAVGVLPPHVWKSASREGYSKLLYTAGATIVIQQVTDLTPSRISELFA